MNPIDSIKERKIFSVLVIVSFLGGAFFLVFVQYISTNYIDELLKENNKLVTANRELAAENIEDSQKNNGTTRNGRFSTPLKFIPNDSISYNAYAARRYLPFALVFIFCVGGVLCWFIIWQLRQLNRLVIKLDLAEKSALESVIVKENFLANMSHEIRTPLNAILGFTNIIRRRNTSPEISEFADAIHHSGENLLRIVNDILDLSKIEAGMMQIITNPFSIRDLINNTASIFCHNEKGLEINVSIDNLIPEIITGDATRLTQILVNLTGNALKFSSKGQICISVVLESKDPPKIVLGFTIADEGIGIDPEKLELIFERFRQAEESITRQYGGTGLGLPIVKNLIHLQNGTITAKSEPGVGTEIYFTIPYNVAKEEPVSISTSDSKQYGLEINPLHILVVEDNVMNQSLMKHLLNEWYFSFVIAPNGYQAIEILKAQNFDIILMDLQMPGMDGYATTQHIREKLQLKIPIIAMTAHTMQGERERCISHGMNAYISKPIDHSEFFRILNKFTTDAITVKTKLQPKIEIPEYAYINLSYIKEVSNGSIAYEKIITEQFIETVPDFLKSMQVAFVDNDCKTINHIAHNIQTSLAIMGLLPKCSELLNILENATTTEVYISAAIKDLTIICDHAVLESKTFRSSLL